MLSVRLLLVTILLFNSANYTPKDRSIFISPLKIPVFLSSNFGELRKDHFHSGLDIKTQGTTGKEVVASASGYIYRITVSPAGFGKALYIRHPSGYSTVYGHLERFAPEIEKYVRDRQYDDHSFLVTLYPAKDEFHVTQGDIIAYSGNSGSSGGPHLHYEIRKSDNETPVNPLLFNLGPEDNIRPVFEKLVIYPEGRETLINKGNSVIKIKVSGGHGKYFISPVNDITISGAAGFGVRAYDLMNGNSNKYAVYSIELSIDGNSVFKYQTDGFKFDETRFVNSHIDYEAYLKENTFYERTFVLPNDRLSLYKDVVNRGIFNFNDSKIHNVVISVSDINKNKSTLTFRVKALTGKRSVNSVLKPPDKATEIMPFGRNNKFRAANISLSIPEGALYDTLRFEYHSVPRTGHMLSDLHCVHNRYTPVHKAYTLSIKPQIIPSGKESKMLLVMVGDDQLKHPVNSTWSEGNLTADLLNFGNFYIGIDTIPPSVSGISAPKNNNYTGLKEMTIRVADDFSGIKSYEPLIDDKWALFEFDLKNNMLIYKFDQERINRKSKHTLILKVSDNRDNVSYFRYNFTW